MTHIEKLAKALDFRTEQEYFDYCIDSYINGNFTQCKKLFNDMTREGQKELVRYIYMQEDMNEKLYNFYFNLL